MTVRFKSIANVRMSSLVGNHSGNVAEVDGIISGNSDRVAIGG